MLTRIYAAIIIFIQGNIYTRTVILINNTISIRQSVIHVHIDYGSVYRSSYIHLLCATRIGVISIRIGNDNPTCAVLPNARFLVVGNLIIFIKKISSSAIILIDKIVSMRL